MMNIKARPKPLSKYIPGTFNLSLDYGFEAIDAIKNFVVSFSKSLICIVLCITFPVSYLAVWLWVILITKKEAKP